MKDLRFRKLLLFALPVIALLICGGQAKADLIHDPNIQITGTGLGAVNTLITIHATGQDTLESGCINANGSFAPCFGGVVGGDNTAINNVLNLNTDQNFVAVVNIAETGQDLTVTLTDLYLGFTGSGGTHIAEYTGVDLDLTQGTGTGIGGSGFTFVLSDAEFAIVQALGSTVTVWGGMQFADGSTNDGPETLFVTQFGGPAVIPEPGTLLLLGTGMAGLVVFARRKRNSR